MSRPAAAVHRVIKAYDVRGLVGSEIDESFVSDVGAAFATLMRSEGAQQVVIGYDMRDSSPSLAAAFAAGVTGQGLDVVRIGLASTDQLYFASGVLDCPGAMFTASHNPAAYNGIKLCRAGAKPVGADTGLTTISDDVIAGVASHEGPTGIVTDKDVLAEYGDFLRSLVDTSGLRPLRVAVDAGNGMAGHTTPAVLGAIDSITLLPLYFELDGSFPNHEANPLDPANLADLQAYVRDSGADIGLAFDGDADRCFVIDERGRPVSPSTVTALVAARELSREIGATVIHNLITSRAVPELVVERGGTPVRSRVGHSYIKGLMADTGAILRSSAANTRRTITSGTSGEPTPGCWPRCMCLPHLGTRNARCPRSPPTTSATSPPARSTSPWPMQPPASKRCSSRSAPGSTPSITSTG
jgi:phosphomannomutase